MLPVFYYRAGEAIAFYTDDEGRFGLPEIGDGWLWADGSRFRVADRWLSQDRHGRFDTGWHVFLDPAEHASADDRLQQLAPDYFED